MCCSYAAAGRAAIMPRCIFIAKVTMGYFEFGELLIGVCNCLLCIILHCLRAMLPSCRRATRRCEFPCRRVVGVCAQCIRFAMYIMRQNEVSVRRFCCMNDYRACSTFRHRNGSGRPNNRATCETGSWMNGFHRKITDRVWTIPGFVPKCIQCDSIHHRRSDCVSIPMGIPFGVVFVCVCVLATNQTSRTFDELGKCV